MRALPRTQERVFAFPLQTHSYTCDWLLLGLQSFMGVLRLILPGQGQHGELGTVTVAW